MRCHGPLLTIAAAASLVACTPTGPVRPPGATSATARAGERAALFALHERQRAVHVGRDAEGFVALLADDFVSVQNGRIQRSTPEENLARFKRYFAAVEFLEWDDIAPPVITLSPDGTLATMAVHKRVTVVPTGVSSSTSASATTHPGQASLQSHPHAQAGTTLFAWIATAEKQDGVWRITQVASTRDPAPAGALIQASIEALGPESARTAIRSLRAAADGVSPRGPYSMTVDSLPGDAVRFFQSSQRGVFEAWIRGDKAWTRDPGDRSAQELDATAISMMRGHEFQLLPMTLDRRFTDWQLAGRAEFAGHPCEVVRARDDLGLPALIFLRRDDQRFAGMLITDPRHQEHSVQVTIDGWREVAGVQMASKVTAIDHQGTFVLTYRDIAANAVDDADWPAFTR